MLKWFRTNKGDPCKDCSELIEKYQEAAYQLAENINKLEVEFADKINKIKSKHHEEIVSRESKYVVMMKKYKTTERHLHNTLDKNRELNDKVQLLSLAAKLPKTFKREIALKSLRVRTVNSLAREGIDSYFKLTQYTSNHLLRMPNFGRKSLNDLKEHIKQEFPDDYMKFSMFDKEIAEIEQGKAMKKNAEDFMEAVIRHNAKIREAIQ